MRVDRLTIAGLMLTGGNAFAMGAQPSGGQASSPWGMFVPLLLMFVVLYFFMIRPQQKRQKEKEKMLEALKKGDRVLTLGGIYGDIQQVKDNVVVLRIAENVKVEVQRSAISSVVESAASE
ncbi:MAG TPA: preprotein translocase subunit YajC [Candidatus Latescibacteria bacterium]|nr:preprotein translocase subunit YajC [Candidatus Latescibacterota bacterium]